MWCSPRVERVLSVFVYIYQQFQLPAHLLRGHTVSVPFSFPLSFKSLSPTGWLKAPEDGGDGRRAEAPVEAQDWLNSG